MIKCRLITEGHSVELIETVINYQQLSLKECDNFTIFLTSSPDAVLLVDKLFIGYAAVY